MSPARIIGALANGDGANFGTLRVEQMKARRKRRVHTEGQLLTVSARQSVNPAQKDFTLLEKTPVTSRV
jgi:hypothetical protein